MSNKRHVILVDDEPMILNTLRFQIEKLLPKNYQIETANNGKEALRLINEIRRSNGLIPLVISDFQMPEMNGSELLLEVCKVIPDCNNILLTGNAELADIRTLINEQALFAYMAKPWEGSELELNLTNAITSFNNAKIIERTQREIAYQNEKLEEAVEQTKLELGAKNQQINQGLEFASLMQNALISDSHELRARFSMVDTLYRPFSQVSGDLYGIYPTTDDNTMVVLGDATGHGVAGSFLSNICLSMLDELLAFEHFTEPFNLITEVLTKFKKLSSNASDRAIQSMISLELTALHVNRDKDSIDFASNSKQLRLFKNGAVVVPVVETFQCCTGNSRPEESLKHRGSRGTISLKDVDTILLYSDGVTDQFMAESGKKLGRKKLAEQLPQIIEHGLDSWYDTMKGNEIQVDDATAVLIKL